MGLEKSLKFFYNGAKTMGKLHCSWSLVMSAHGGVTNRFMSTRGALRWPGRLSLLSIRSLAIK